MNKTFLAVVASIARERLRQRKLQGAGRFKHTCDSHEISNFQKLAIATEELGEIAREIFEMHDKNDFSPARLAALRKEQVQLAAVMVAWLETPSPLSGGRSHLTANNNRRACCTPATAAAGEFQTA
jgi:hypothetical protein